MLKLQVAFKISHRHPYFYGFWSVFWALRRRRRTWNILRGPELWKVRSKNISDSDAIKAIDERNQLRIINLKLAHWQMTKIVMRNNRLRLIWWVKDYIPSNIVNWTMLVERRPAERGEAKKSGFWRLNPEFEFDKGEEPISDKNGLYKSCEIWVFRIRHFDVLSGVLITLHKINLWCH